MPEKTSLDWSNKDDIEGVSFPRDTLNRAKYAGFLTTFLEEQGCDTTRESGDEKRNYVLNLNSEWGSGKTYFLKRWSNNLKDHFPVVYIDAWQQDYSDDPLMTAISSIIKQLREQADMPEDSPEFQLPKKLLGLLKAAAPGMVRSFSKKYFGFDAIDSFTSNEEKPTEDDDVNSVDLSDAAAEAVKYLIDEHDAKSKAIEDLKKSVAQWVENVVIHKELAYPAFIFIDELDRCRPSYAVEMLETIKHIFDIKGIVFVVATDTEQLQHAVKAIYGEGFDARLYLGRFFNSRFSLKAPDLKSFLEVHTDISKLSGEYFTKKEIQILPPNEDAKITLDNISVILDAFNMPPRTAIQIADRIVATISNMPKDSKIDILMLTTLLCLNEEDHKRFQDIVAGRFEYKNKKGKDIFLSGYLSERFEQNNDIFKIQINPSEYSNTFNHQYQTTCTRYPAGLYNTPLNDYLRDLFSPHCGSQNNFAGTLDLYGDADTQTPFERIQEELLTNYSQLRRENKPLTDSGLLWLQAHYYKDKFDQVSIDQYRDYVELASSLDLIEEGTQNE